jgi:hypothetical protein
MNIALAMAAQKGVAAVSLDEGAAAPGACPHLLSDGLVVRSLIGVAALATACDRRGGIDRDPLAGVVTGAGNSTLLDDIELFAGSSIVIQGTLTILVLLHGCYGDVVSDYQFNNANNVPWRKSTFAEGIEVKDLGTADGRSMQLVRFAPGASFPLHQHVGPEFIYLLEGVAIQEGQELSAGWTAVAAMGTTDSNFHSPTGCVFLTVYTD